MAKSVKEPVSLSTLYAELQRFGEAQSYEKALKTADTILKSSPGEVEAFHYKVVCLSQLNDFQNALVALEKRADLAGGLTFEKAYCEYRLYKNQVALKTLRSAETLDLRCKELLAQLLYRLEDYEGSLQLYKEVVKNSQDEYDDERHTNVSAVTAALSLVDPGAELESPDISDCNYDRCYNAACFLIGRGDYNGAETQLNRAEELCRVHFEEEDMTEEEKEDELAMIRVQLAYCAQMLGKTNKAMKVYNTLFKSKPTDIAVTAVAANNAVTLNQDQNVFDSKKKMKLATAPELANKLIQPQRRAIDVNNCILAFYSNQVDVCSSLCKNLVEKYPEDAGTSALIESSLLVKTRQPVKALQLLQAYVGDSKAGDEANLRVQFALASLHLNSGNAIEACSVLRKLGPVTYRPAIVSLLISLYMSQENNSSVSEFFTDVISWYEKNENDCPAFRDILQAAAEFQLKIKNARLAATLLEKLIKLTPSTDHRPILSMLFAAYSQFDDAKAKKVSNELPSIESLAESIDVQALEESSAFAANKYKAKKDDKTAASTSPPEGSDELLDKKKKSKKKRKGKLPKEYNPNVDADPERWLPKRERSTWKGRRRDKRKENTIGKGSQGATVVGGPELDITKMESSTSDSVSQPIAAGNKGFSASKQQQKKKKIKKGKK